jgi:hypothetical protein
MANRHPSKVSDEPAPLSSAPTVISVVPSARSAAPAGHPLGLAGIGMCGVVGFTLARLTLPPQDVAVECVQAALADYGGTSADGRLDLELVLSGKLEVGGKRPKEIADGPLSDAVRRRAIEGCRAVYAKEAGLSAASPLLTVETAPARIDVRRTLERAAGKALEKLEYPAPGAQVSVENRPAIGSCITSSSGECELILRNLGHDAELTVSAELANGAVVSREATVLELLQDGLTLEARERMPPPPPDCVEASRRVQDGAQFTRIPGDAAGHALEASVEVMSSGIVSDIQPAAGSDPAAMVALRSQLATLRGLPGPCSDLSVSLHY